MNGNLSPPPPNAHEPSVVFGELTAAYRGLTLRSVFQPIASVVLGGVVGYEVLLRATNRSGHPVSTPMVFDEAAEVDELEILNRIVCELHLKNFRNRDPEHCLLFINISTGVFCQLVEETVSLIELAAEFGISTGRIAIEILENDFLDDDNFSRCVIKCKEAGFLVALDDFGKGLSNFDRVLNFAPSVVKYDMSLVSKARSNAKLRRAYYHLTAMLHEVGTMVLAEGIESVEDALLMVDAGVDFLQGYWIARPAAAIGIDAVSAKIRELKELYAIKADDRETEDRNDRGALRETMLRAAERYAEAGDIAGAAGIFLALPSSKRFYVLDENGFDVAVGEAPNNVIDLRATAKVGPFRATKHSSMIHRDYFREAIRRPNEVHFHSPVFSFLDGATFDIVVKAVSRDGRRFVVCGLYLRQ